MKHVIIGGTGFTGRYLTQHLLQQGERVLVCGVDGDGLGMSSNVEYLALDITEPGSMGRLRLEQHDIVYHLAARQYHDKVPRTNRDAYFAHVNVDGTRNVLEHMARESCGKLVFFSTDMVYGHPQRVPIDESHERRPFGPYGASKRIAEDLCGEFRRAGFRVTTFRPRLIIGPGRLGILQKLFKLIRHNLPVPLIGVGSNRYQMISVFDCVSAIICAVDRGLPNETYNLGSDEPPTVRDLLNSLIRSVGSRSVLIRTPAQLGKRVLGALDRVGLTLMHREQFMIADENYLVDITKARSQLGWVPKYRDEDMMQQAYEEFASAVGALPSVIRT